MNNKILKPVGWSKINEETYHVSIGGAFQMYDTMGFPLFMSFDIAAQRGFEINIPHVVFSAFEQGWLYDDILEFVRFGLSDAGFHYKWPKVKEKIHSYCALMMTAYKQNNPDDGTFEWFKRYGTFGRESMELNFYATLEALITDPSTYESVTIGDFGKMIPELLQKAIDTTIDNIIAFEKVHGKKHY